MSSMVFFCSAVKTLIVFSSFSLRMAWNFSLISAPPPPPPHIMMVTISLAVAHEGLYHLLSAAGTVNT
jgi:hypothetical protein